MTNIIIVFCVLSIANVIGSTIRSLITIKAKKGPAAASSALYFAFYNIVMIYTVADFPLWVKCVITFGCNLIGVFIVKWFEERHQPIRMWKVEMAIKCEQPEQIKEELNAQGIPCRYGQIGKWSIFDCYCDTRHQSSVVKEIAYTFNGKISAYESKPL